jgi:hypothetical protein
MREPPLSCPKFFPPFGAALCQSGRPRLLDQLDTVENVAGRKFTGSAPACFPGCNALHLRHALQIEKVMTAPAERMKMMRQRRRARGLRELRLVVADPRSRAVRRRVAKQVASLDLDRELDALKWIESVSEFDADATR